MNNPNMPYLRVGEIILYNVNKGDNVYRISQMFNSDPMMIKCLNHLNDDYLIQPDMQLLIPIIFHHTMKPHNVPYRESYDLYF